MPNHVCYWPKAEVKNNGKGLWVKEKLQEYALIAEIISAAAVVADLVFVGLVVRQGAEETAANTVAIRGSVRQAMMEADKDLMLFQAQARYDQRYFHIELENPTPLEIMPPEFLYWGAFFRTRFHYWNQYEAGLLDKYTYVTYMNSALISLAANPEARDAYFSFVETEQFPKAFADEINRLWSERFPDVQFQKDP